MFRIRRETFSFILCKTEHYIPKKETAETPIIPSKCLGVCLYKLAMGDYYCTISY